MKFLTHITLILHLILVSYTFKPLKAQILLFSFNHIREIFQIICRNMEIILLLLNIVISLNLLGHEIKQQL